MVEIGAGGSTSARANTRKHTPDRNVGDDNMTIRMEDGRWSQLGKTEMDAC